jgi:transposase-like protein
VRWYLRFRLSFRDLVEMMAERGLSLAHTTILRWVQSFAPEFEQPKHHPVSAKLEICTRAVLASCCPFPGPASARPA